MNSKELIKQNSIRQEIVEFLTKEIDYLEYNQDMSMLSELKQQILDSPITNKWTYVKIYNSNEQWNSGHFQWVILKNNSLLGLAKLIRTGRFICFSGKDKIHKDWFYKCLSEINPEEKFIYQRYDPTIDIEFFEVQ